MARFAPITHYGSHGASAAPLADGSGEAHVYLLRFEAGGEVGRHEAGFGQLLIAVEGSGWVSGGDGERRPLRALEPAHIARGEVHAKGSDTGMTALMVQVRDLEPVR